VIGDFALAAAEVEAEGDSEGTAAQGTAV